MIITLKAFLKLSHGAIQTDCVKVWSKEENNVTAYYIKGSSRHTLDIDYSAGIELCLDDIEAYVANYKYSTFWCKAQFGSAVSEVPDNTQALIYRKKDGKCGVILPLVSDVYKCVLEGNDGGITAKLFSWCEGLYDIEAPAFVMAEGNNPYELLKCCAEYGIKILNNCCRTREERRYPEIFEYLGWCSWDAFQINVDETGLIKKCEEFKEKNIPIKWAIIDDMWGEVRDFYGFECKERGEQMFTLMHASKLYSFAADPKRFPNGLKHCIDEIKKFGMSVGMWHPTTGYWRGIDPNGTIAEKCKDYLIKSHNGMLIHNYSQDKAYMFYNAYHDYLRKCGAEFVKIDNQSAMAYYYKNLAPIGVTSREYHKGMEASVGEHFDNVMINCMGMAIEDMWNRSVSPISRCSNDFKPEDREWFTEHILQCTFNSLIQGQFYHEDYDMWWTDDEQAVKNSILRAISGGPIYVSDELGRSRREVLMPLCLEDGKILRCDRPAMPTIDCMLENPVESEKTFKVQNICGDTGYVAVFNLNKNGTAVSGTVSPSDVDGLVGDSFVIYEHFTQKYWFVDKTEKIDIVLKNNDDFALYKIVPVVDGFAVIGRTDKYISSKTVTKTENNNFEVLEKGEVAFVKDNKLWVQNI